MNCEPLEGGPKVIVVGFEAFRELGFRVYAPCVALGGESAKGTCVTAPQLVGLAGLLELLGRVLANRLEHQEAVVRDRLQKAEIDERAQRVEVRVTNLLGGGKWEAPGKDREPAEEDLRLRVEQVVTPLDRCPQCSLVFRDVPGAAGEKGQGVIEALQKQIRAQELRARRGELDRER